MPSVWMARIFSPDVPEADTVWCVRTCVGAGPEDGGDGGDGTGSDEGGGAPRFVRVDAVRAGVEPAATLSTDSRGSLGAWAAVPEMESRLGVRVSPAYVINL